MKCGVLFTILLTYILKTTKGGKQDLILDRGGGGLEGENGDDEMDLYPPQSPLTVSLRN